MIKEEGYRTKYCDFCEDDTSYSKVEEDETMDLNGVTITYTRIKNICNECGNEVYIEEDNIINVKNANYEYRKKIGLIQVDEIKELLNKYNIGKTTLAVLLGWGEITIVRYLEGKTPSKEYSDILKSLLIPEIMKNLLENNRGKIADIAYKKCNKALENYLDETSIDTCHNVLENVANYFISKDFDITPLALQKLLYFSQGFYYALRKKFLFIEDCEAWVHGPVYPQIYSKYSFFGYKPINIKCSYILSEEITSLLDGVLKAFACYNGKILEKFTHSETPWNQARIGKKDDETSSEVITKDSIGLYFENIVKKYNITNVYDIDIYACNLKSKVL